MYRSHVLTVRQALICCQGKLIFLHFTDLEAEPEPIRVRIIAAGAQGQWQFHGEAFACVV